MRTRKSTNTNRTYYDRDASGNLVHEFRDYSGYLGEDSHLYYYYDANGNIGSISYNGVRYAFRKNLQGDVIATLDTSGKYLRRLGKGTVSDGCQRQHQHFFHLHWKCQSNPLPRVLLRHGNRMVLSGDALLGSASKTFFEQ